MATPVFSFHDLLRTEAVRQVEVQTPLDADGTALRAAAARADLSREARIVERARLLAGPLGLDDDIARLATAVKATALLLIVLGLLLAGSIVGNVLGQGRTLNAAAALGLALVPNAVGLPLWIGAVLMARGGEGVLGAALRQAARLGLLRRRMPEVLTAASRVLDRHRLTAWAWGGANHALWAVAYAAALAMATFAFGVRAYRLGWETTILTPGFFDGFYRAVAWLPARLGWPVGDAAAVAAGGPGASAALAWWVLGGLLVYGLGVRMIALAACWLRWQVGRRRLVLDTADPYVRTLLNRLDALAPTQVLDVERPGPGSARRSDRPAAGATAQGPFDVLAFELPAEVAVPDAVLDIADHADRIDGTRDERDAVLQRHAARPPARLLLVAHAGSTPDRGTQRFFAAVRAPATALLLVPPADVQSPGPRRWRAWLDDVGFDDVALLADAASALAWAGPQEAAAEVHR